MNIVRNLTAGAIICLASASAFAQSKGLDLLKSMESKFQGVKSVQGTFTQKSEAPQSGFGNTAQTANVAFQILKPGYFKAEYTDAGSKSGARVHLITNNKYFYYQPSLKQVNTYTFKNQSSINDLNFILLGFGAKTEDISRVYKIEDGPSANSVKLTPRNAQGATYRYIIMKVDPKSSYPTEFSMQQTDNSKITVNVNLSNLNINPALTPDNFNRTWDPKLEVPMQ